jgi:hypothetical protein
MRIDIRDITLNNWEIIKKRDIEDESLKVKIDLINLYNFDNKNPIFYYKDDWENREYSLFEHQWMIWRDNMCEVSERDLNFVYDNFPILIIKQTDIVWLKQYITPFVKWILEIDTKKEIFWNRNSKDRIILLFDLFNDIYLEWQIWYLESIDENNEEEEKEDKKYANNDDVSGIQEDISKLKAQQNKRIQELYNYYILHKGTNNDDNLKKFESELIDIKEENFDYFAKFYLFIIETYIFKKNIIRKNKENVLLTKNLINSVFDDWFEDWQNL